MNARYGNERIRRGLVHFMFGKSISAFTGIIAILLVIRTLTVQDFAAYSILVAFVEIFTVLAGLGLVHVLLRYVPELYGRHYQESLKKLVLGAIVLRSSLLLVVGVLSYFFADLITPLVGLTNSTQAFQAFLACVILRSTTHFLSQILESTLHQSIVQFGFTLATVVRLIGMLYLHQQTHVELISVIWIEAFSDLTSMLVMSYGVIHLLKSQQVTLDSKADKEWLPLHFRAIIKFAVAGYLQHLAITPSGGHTNRLVGGGMLNVGAMAAYGFAQTFYEYIKRYMPAQLLVGLVRPVVVARYCEHLDFSVPAKMCSQVLQINILLVAGLFVMAMVGGGEAIQVISNGKYGQESLIVLSCLLIVLLLETQRQQLELLVQTVEHYDFLIFSNILLSSSVLLAVVLIPWLSAAAFPVANTLGLLVANHWVQYRLRQTGFKFQHEWSATSRIALITIMAVCVGALMKCLGLAWHISTFIAFAAYALATYLIGGAVVLRFMRELTGNRINQLPALPLPTIFDKPKIAFGILSSKHSANAIDEIARVVYPHPVFVHHDFSKVSDFRPKAKNVIVLKDFVHTSWAGWSLVEATYRLMCAALEDTSVTHFQLLSEACLPVQSVQAFEQYLTNKKPDVMIDFMPLNDTNAFYSHGWRYLTKHRILMKIHRRASIWVRGEVLQPHQVASVNLHLPTPPQSFKQHIKSVIGQLICHIFGWFSQNFLLKSGLKQLAIGGQWFGASRHVTEWLISARHALVIFTRHYADTHIPDESYVHTLVYNAQLSGLKLKIVAGNHAIFWDECGTGPDILSDAHFNRIVSENKCFARKFSIESSNLFRLKMLTHLDTSSPESIGEP